MCILVKRKTDQNILNCKWVFKDKLDENAHLVANGMKQRSSIGFEETFALVIKPTTIRLILLVVVTQNWTLRQLVVSNAFLHGVLEEVAYMKQPPSYRDPLQPTHICKLIKSNDGLKQSPQDWFRRLCDYSFLLASSKVNRANPYSFTSPTRSRLTSLSTSTISYSHPRHKNSL